MRKLQNIETESQNLAMEGAEVSTDTSYLSDLVDYLQACLHLACQNQKNRHLRSGAR